MPAVETARSDYETEIKGKKNDDVSGIHWRRATELWAGTTTDPPTAEWQSPWKHPAFIPDAAWRDGLNRAGEIWSMTGRPVISLLLKLHADNKRASYLQAGNSEWDSLSSNPIGQCGA